MHNAKPIFAFLKAAAERGQRTALVTVTAVTGASTRNPGTHMAVAEDGSFAGSLSGGCIEVAVVGEAQAAIKDGLAREARFGAGSPYIDIRLPCGGSIDLLFTPLPDGSLAENALARLTAREPVALDLPMLDGTEFHVNHVPALRIAIIGHGATVEALHKQAIAFGAETLVMTPDAAIVDSVKAHGDPAILLKTPSAQASFVTDPWTASVFTFHDHDWEGALIKQALAQPGFFVGCMGSHKTHAARREMLAAFGVVEADLDRIVAPIGLIPSSRDPETLALSILAQVVDAYHRQISNGR
jgi:xanthine dehydrogenase accessory factor